MVNRCIGERVNSSDNDSQDGIESTISFANLGLIYISITPKSGVKGKGKALWGICRQAEAQVRIRIVGAPEICYFIDNPVALTCTSVHPCPPSVSTKCVHHVHFVRWVIESCFLSSSFRIDPRHQPSRLASERVGCTVLIYAYMAADFDIIYNSH
jgi:hypothetical protein